MNTLGPAAAGGGGDTTVEAGAGGTGAVVAVAFAPLPPRVPPAAAVGVAPNAATPETVDVKEASLPSVDTEDSDIADDPPPRASWFVAWW